MNLFNLYYTRMESLEEAVLAPKYGTSPDVFACCSTDVGCSLEFPYQAPEQFKGKEVWSLREWW